MPAATELNTTLSGVNETSQAATYPVSDDWIAVGAILPASVVGLFIYVLFIIAVVTTDEYRKNSYYMLAAALGILDCITLTGIIFFSVPSILYRDSFGGPLVNIYVGSALIMGWYGALPIICTLAFNRFYCVCKREEYKLKFTVKRTLIIICCSYVFGIGYGVAPMFPCCHYLFYATDYSWGWDVSQYGGFVINNLELCLTCLVVIIAGICNALVFAKYRKMHREIASDNENARQEAIRREREFKLFVQFFVIVLWMTLFDAMFVIAPLVEASKWFFLLISFMYVIQCSINAWVYFLMNKSVRGRIAELLHFKSKAAKHSMVVTRQKGVSQAYPTGHKSSTMINSATVHVQPQTLEVADTAQ